MNHLLADYVNRTTHSDYDWLKPRRRFPWRWLAAVAGVIALGWFVCCGVVTK